MAQATIRRASQPPKAVNAIKSVLGRSNTLLNTDATIVLACGKQPNLDYPGGRDHIIKYAEKHLKKFQFFVAEKVFKSLGNTGIDLLTLEASLLDFCDCILIVLESESTYAELGAFAIDEKLAKNMLVINDSDFEACQSFISLGPLAKIDKISRFGPVIYTDLKTILRAVPELKHRLSKIEKKNRKRFPLKDFGEFQEAQAKIRILFLLDMITFFQPLKYKEIIGLLKTYYGNHSFDIHLDLHVLHALGLITMIKEYYMRPTDNQKFFFAYYGLNEISVRSDVVNHYHKYSTERVSILKDRLGELPWLNR
ncbi:MAG: hypothetical protein ISS77_00710 [Phycisphaerae bacterium]|nr:hypothetical protein [Phycisphaerae bacterium]